MLRDHINDAVKTAMKAQDKLRLSTLRMVNSAIKNADIEARGARQGPARRRRYPRPAAEADQAAPGIRRALRQGRPPGACRRRSATEIEIITAFLPQQLSEAEAKAAIADVIRETGAAGMKDMGKVIAALKERYAGRMDFGKASALVKGMLTG